MDALFRLKTKDVPAPAAGVKVLKADEVAELKVAADLIAAAKLEAEAIRQKAEEAYQARYQEGYAEGIEMGKMENAEKMMETVMASVEFIENIESTVVSVVSQSIRKIIGDMEDDARIRAIVGTALNNMRGQQKVTVRVSPKDEQTVNNAFAAMTQSGYLNVVADSRLAPDSCIMESDLGIVDASLKTQMTALEHAFESKIRR